MHRQFSFDLEPSRHCGKGFDVASGKNLVAGQHVGELPAENTPHHRGQDVVAESMPPSVGVHALRHSGAVDEVEALVDRAANHPGGGLRFIGRVAVDQHKDIRVNVGEHATNDVALTLARLVADNRARGPSDIDGAIGRVVIVNVDSR
jgi:hypothetical protein